MTTKDTQGIHEDLKRLRELWTQNEVCRAALIEACENNDMRKFVALSEQLDEITIQLQKLRKKTRHYAS